MAFPLLHTTSRALAFIALAILISPPVVTAAGDELYVDQSLGFSFSKPHFTPSEVKDVTTTAISLAGAPDAGFAPNVNVIVQNIEITLDAYQRRQAEEMSTLGWEVIEQTQTTIGGKSVLRTHVRGSVQGLEVEFLMAAMTRNGKKLFVLTCSATPAQFPKYEAEFNRVVSSFALAP